MPLKDKILILIDQNEVHNAIQIAKRLQKNFDIIFFITDLASSYDNNHSSQKLLKSNFAKANIIDLRSELIKLNTAKKFNNIDYYFLNKFEQEISSKSIIKNFLKDVLLNNLYGSRDIFYHPKNKDIYFKFCEIILKKIKKIFLKNKVKFVYSIDTSNFVRNTILEYCKIKNIPFYWVSYGLFNKLYLTDLSSKDRYLEKKFKPQSKYFNFLQKILLKNSNKIENINLLLHSRFFRKRIFQKFVYYIKIFRNDSYGIRKQRINIKRPNYFYTTSFFKSMVYWIKKEFNAFYVQQYCKKNQLSKINKIKKNKFIYYPLHVTPEAGVYDQAELYDQLYLIQKIAKNLPIDTFLVVKPHPSNFMNASDRDIQRECEDLKWFKEIDKIFNVILVSHAINSLFLIKNSLGIVTVSGSACVEANLLEKPSFMFGSNEFSFLYGVYKFTDNFFSNIKNFDKKKLKENYKFYNYFVNNSFELKDQSDFLVPINEFAKSKKCKDVFDFFAKQILNTKR